MGVRFGRRGIGMIAASSTTWPTVTQAWDGGIGVPVALLTWPSTIVSESKDTHTWPLSCFWGCGCLASQRG